MTYTVNVTGVGQTSGDFLLGFYLPGDAHGTVVWTSRRPPDRQELAGGPINLAEL